MFRIQDRRVFAAMLAVVLAPPLAATPEAPLEAASIS